MGRGDGLQNRPFRIPRRDGKAELGINDARRGVGVGVRVNARRHPHQNILRPPGAGADAFQQIQFVKAVHHDAPDAGGHRLGQFRRRLVVAVKIDALRRHLGGQGHRQLAAGYHIQPQPLLGENPRQRRVDVGFGGVHRPRVGAAGGKGAGKLPAAGAQGGFVQHIKGRAVMFGQRRGIAAADAQMPGGIGGGGIGQNMGQARGQHNGKGSGGVGMAAGIM